VMKYRAQGLGYKRIIRSVAAELGDSLSQSMVSDWIRGNHLPDGSVRMFEPVPNPALCYVIGAFQGDGSSCFTGDHVYMIKLKVKDKDFAEAFSIAVGIILGIRPPWPRYDPRRNYWCTELASLLLMEFLRKPLEEIRPIVEHCPRCSSAFLRGFFDAEGCVSAGSITASNSDGDLLDLVTAQLDRLSIEFTGPYLTSRGGRTVIIKGKPYRANHDVYIIRIRNVSRRAYLDKVDFMIQRKHARLLSIFDKDYKSPDYTFDRARRE
jgi:DNA endonuclease